MNFDDIVKLGGGYWKHDILDFYYLKNHYFPTKEMYEILKKELPMLCSNYPSSQKVIAKSLAKWKDEEYFNEDNLIVGNGSSELISYLINIMDDLSRYYKVTIPIPTYNDYLKLTNRKFFYPCEANKYKIDVDELISVMDKSDSRFLVLINPNNPTGNIVTRAGIKKILDTGVYVIVDEAFIDFCKENSVQDLVQEYVNLIVVASCTKTMGLSGLRLGYILTTNKYIKRMRSTLPRWNVNSLSERFIELFPEYKHEYWDSIKKTIDDRDYLFKELKKTVYLEPFESHANFILCKTKMSAKVIAEHLYLKDKILVRPGLIQKSLKEDEYLRIAVNIKKDNDKLILALKEIYEVKK